MVTHIVDNQTKTMPKMTTVHSCKTNNDSNSSELHLLENEQERQDSCPSISRNSVYKLKIDLLFDDTRSVRSNRLDDPQGSHRTRSIIMYGRSELSKAKSGKNSTSIANYLHESVNESANSLADKTKKDVQRISNTVQAQIEKLFNDVAKDAINTFTVTCLGSVPLNEKIHSLQGLQKPLRELYCSDRNGKELISGVLEICSTGLHIKIIRSDSTQSCNEKPIETDNEITPFHNIAVWSAVKFIISSEEGGAAFLPLITSPDNIDKKSLFQPLNACEKKNLPELPHAPLFVIVMRSASKSKVLECHAYICRTTEDAIIIAATLYQSLMSHVNFSTHRNTKQRPPRNQNGISCISIASSSAITSPNYMMRPQMITNSRKTTLRGSVKLPTVSSLSRSGRKKRHTYIPLNYNVNIMKESIETSPDKRKRKSHKARRAPPIPMIIPMETPYYTNKNLLHKNINAIENGKHSQCSRKKSAGDYHEKSLHNLSYDITSPLPMLPTLGSPLSAGISSTDDNKGDILTRVAIPRSGSFLNTTGLTRYKSRAANRYSNKLETSLNGCGNGGLGGGGGSPLGFSELFNEFRLHENLHSLDEILNAIINSDGMSFNDLKPIYKEFLLKLAVTLTKDELFQRSKNIMRRQIKKKRKMNGFSDSQRKTKSKFFGRNTFINVFRLDQFRSCRGKLSKLSRNKEQPNNESSTIVKNHERKRHSQRPIARHNKMATSGSDVSVIRPDNTFHRINRNSSSGYVSCSECSYDSEACTCTSADRCYCSLRARKTNNNNGRRKHDHKHLRKIDKSKSKNGNKNDNFKHKDLINHQRNSYIPCKSAEKCYCSLVEGENPNVKRIDKKTEVERENGEREQMLQSDNQSETIWCDTDSCKSVSKCYCKKIIHTQSEPIIEGNNLKNPNTSNTIKKCNKSSNQLALNYEMFNINGNSQSVPPYEALSVKKSVEAAAIFADVKLSQTTDIKNLTTPQILQTNAKSFDTCKSYSISARRQSSNQLKRDTLDSIERHDMANSNVQQILTHNVQKSSSSNDLLNKLSHMGKNIYQTSLGSSVQMKTKEIILQEKFQNNYQSMQTISTSLEDALGYLP